MEPERSSSFARFSFETLGICSRLEQNVTKCSSDSHQINSSLQILFVSKQIICPARDKFSVT